MEAALELVRSHSGPSALLVLFVAAALEYMLPPVPGDSIVLAGSLLVVAGAWPFWVVLVVAVAGGFLGSTVHYGLGRLGGHRAHRWIVRFAGEKGLQRFEDAFQHRGLWVIAVNRALPGVRAIVFLAAGVLEVPPARALGVGLISNIVWSTGLLVLGVSIGDNAEKISAALGVYQWVAAGLAVFGIGVYMLWRRRRRRPEENA
ncbi:MAG: DedA family protein [Myxococcota bacterium]